MKRAVFILFISCETVFAAGASGESGLVINEISALGLGHDWVELYNASSGTIQCAPVMIRDSLDAAGNEFPFCIGNLRPGERYIVTCPNLLNGNGEDLALYDRDGNLLDHVSYGRQAFNLTFGRKTDGADALGYLLPTEKTENGTVPPDTYPVIIGAPYQWPVSPQSGEGIFVSAAVVTADAAMPRVNVLYYTGTEEPENEHLWEHVQCNDDGAGMDESAGDNCFTAQLPAFSSETIIRYRISARDSSGNVTYAPSEDACFGIHIDFSPPPVVINEVLGSNTTTGRYSFGGSYHYSDWIELYNAGDSPIDIKRWSLTDKRTASTPFPIIGKGNTVIPPHGHLLIWAQRGFPEESTVNIGVNFNISRNGEEIILFADDGFSVVDRVQSPSLSADTSYCRIQDGAPDFFVCDSPTPSGGVVYPPKYAEVISYDPLLPALGDTVTVKAHVSPEIEPEVVRIYYWLMEEGREPLSDDGADPDELAGDGIYTGTIGPFNTIGSVYFALEVEDGTHHDQIYRDPEQMMLWYSLPISWSAESSLKITEVFAGSHLCCCSCRCFQSLSGPLEPWNFIEVYNGGGQAVDLRSLFLTDNPLDKQKHQLNPPEGVDALRPGGYYVEWFYGGDERMILDPEEGGTVFLYEQSSLMNAVTYGKAAAGRSHGFATDAMELWGELPVLTPGASNSEDIFMRGDPNGDVRIDIADPITIVLHLFGSFPVQYCDAADADDNGMIDINDALYLLQYLFTGGPPPAPPFPEMGSDETSDAIDCSS